MGAHVADDEAAVATDEVTGRELLDELGALAVGADQPNVLCTSVRKINTLLGSSRTRRLTRSCLNGPSFLPDATDDGEAWPDPAAADSGTTRDGNATDISCV